MGLTTGFKKIAESGQTIDGRKIEAQWLIDAADSYSKSTYTAMVFPDHNMNAYAYGTVEALKYEKSADGKVSLFADLMPNTLWQSDVRYGQNIFTSIAIAPNFANTGKAYMYSLGATNTPASLGTEQLNFSTNNSDKGLIFSSPLAVSVNLDNSNQSDKSEELFKGFLKNLFTFSTQDKTSVAELINPEKITALETANTEFKTKITALETANNEYKAKVTALETTVSEFKTKNTELETKFTAFETKNTELETKFTELKTVVDNALKEVPGTTNEFSNVKMDDDVKSCY